MDGRMDGWTDGRTDRGADRRHCSFFCFFSHDFFSAWKRFLYTVKKGKLPNFCQKRVELNK